MKEKYLEYFKDTLGVEVTKVEGEEGVDSYVFHVDPSVNSFLEEKKEQIEKDLDVVIVLSQNYGMNVVIIESNNLE
jgi:hypothetical protein